MCVYVTRMWGILLDLCLIITTCSVEELNLDFLNTKERF